ncbi:hypothetical protein DID77_03050 [Candidatus Marinamargulisbacteria bacterium SCGC AG-439-L15]|nr:hypothetical protein DID77_03050 [Candidatus Marinamargulisbacteria bacterium SCGC AG-439-L15]
MPMFVFYKKVAVVESIDRFPSLRPSISAQNRPRFEGYCFYKKIAVQYDLKSESLPSYIRTNCEKFKTDILSYQVYHNANTRESYVVGGIAGVGQFGTVRYCWKFIRFDSKVRDVVLSDPHLVIKEPHGKPLSRLELSMSVKLGALGLGPKATIANFKDKSSNVTTMLILENVYPVRKQDVCQRLFDEMEYLTSRFHSHGLVHLDVKPEHFAWSESGSLVLIDAGAVGRQSDWSELKNYRFGTIGYSLVRSMDRLKGEMTSVHWNTVKKTQWFATYASMIELYLEVPGWKLLDSILSLSSPDQTLFNDVKIEPIALMMYLNEFEEKLTRPLFLPGRHVQETMAKVSKYHEVFRQKLMDKTYLSQLPRELKTPDRVATFLTHMLYALSAILSEDAQDEGVFSGQDSAGSGDE